jgi:hypothetical protein
MMWLLGLHVHDHHIFARTRSTLIMCTYLNIPVIHKNCPEQHKLIDRHINRCPQRGTYNVCLNAQPTPNAALGSSKKPGNCPVCAGQRELVIIVSQSL